MESLVSIVVPVYNVEKYLDRCINSIVNQTYRKLEIILVDDGSPDNCPKMCDDWAEKDSRIKVIHKQNAGLGMARNSGMEIATGKYILFVDSDDYISRHTTERCIEEVKKNQADVVMFGRYDVFTNGKIKEFPLISDELIFSGIYVVQNILPGLFIYERGTGISSCCKMYNLDLIKEKNIKYKSEREILSEDAIFNLELFTYVKSVALIPESFYYYYKNETSLTRSYKNNFITLNNNFLQTALSICSNNGYNKQTIENIRARYHIYAFTGMKQIHQCCSKKEKKKLLDEMLKDKSLYESITYENLKSKIFPLKIFFMLVKFRLYFVCRFLLKFTDKF